MTVISVKLLNIYTVSALKISIGFIWSDMMWKKGLQEKNMILSGINKEYCNNH